MGAVEDVEDGARDGDDEEEEDDEEDQPEKAGAAAATAVAASVVGLRAVGGARGTIELGLRGRESAVSGCSGGGAVGGVGLSRGIDPVCHGVSSGSLERKSSKVFVQVLREQIKGK